MKQTTLTLLASAALVCGLGGCKRENAAKADTAPATQTAPQAPMGNMATGKVLETMDAANYTYVRVGTDKGEIWAAATQFKVTVGEKVMVPLDMPMENFQSPTLKRTFPVIYFTSRIFKDGEMPGMQASR